jgi:hypothetical protein
MKIASSRFPAAHPDRDLQCQELIAAAMSEIIDVANMRGWSTAEVLSAMDEALKHLHVASAKIRSL